MRFINPLAFVEKIARSKQFYRDVLGLAITQEHDDFVQFETGFAIHAGDALQKTVWGNVDVFESYGRKNCVFYFEHDDIETAFDEISPKVELIHGLQRQHWGQRVFRFYDPDGHAIEIGEA